LAFSKIEEVRSGITATFMPRWNASQAVQAVMPDFDKFTFCFQQLDGLIRIPAALERQIVGKFDKIIILFTLATGVAKFSDKEDERDYKEEDRRSI
jgi:hypothetical protein